MACVRKRQYKGGWRYMLDFYDHQGKRQRQILPDGTTKTAAKEMLRSIEEQVTKGLYVPEQKILSFAEVASDWIAYKKVNLRPSTWSVYEGHVRNHFHDWHDLKLNRITTAKVEKFIIDRQESGMNILTLRKLLVTVGQIFSYAVRHGYISYNPLADAERPRGTGKSGDKKKKISILSKEEIKDFIGLVDDHKYKTLFMLAIMSGARQGELLGLKWPDIDWKRNQIHVQRTFNNQAWYEPKTKASNRRIDIGPAVMSQLKKWKLACPPNEIMLVFPNEAGNPINHNNMVRRYFEPALKKAGIDKIRFHDLRHTYASILIEQGENIKYIQSQLGHSSPTVTLNVYAHLMNPTNQSSASKLEKVLF